jgi:hypothetical protein
VDCVCPRFANKRRRLLISREQSVCTLHWGPPCLGVRYFWVDYLKHTEPQLDVVVFGMVSVKVKPRREREVEKVSSLAFLKLYGAG